MKVWHKTGIYTLYGNWNEGQFLLIRRDAFDHVFLIVVDQNGNKLKLPIKELELIEESDKEVIHVI